MGWLFVAISLASATLRDGENPYKILGVPKTATKEEIKAAFRKLTMDLHPDRNKDKDTTAQWVQVNDAYELLSDPDRKVMFDRYGVVGDTGSTETHDDPFQGMNERFFQKKPRINVDASTPLLTPDTIDGFLNTGNECLILVYSSVMCHECDIYLDMFETFARQYGSYCSCARIDCAKNADLAKVIGVDGMPTIAYYKKTEDGVVSDYIKTVIHTVKSITHYLASHWNMNLYDVHDEKEYESFMSHNEGSTKVLQLVRYGGPTLAFMRLSAQLRADAIFAVVNTNFVDCATRFGVRTYPSYVIVRHPEAPHHVLSSTKAVKEAIKDWARPTMVEITSYNFETLCADECLARIGKAPSQVIQDICQSNISTFWIPADTKAAAALGCKEGEWVLLKPSKGKYARFEGKEKGEWGKIVVSLKEPVMESLPPNFKIDWSFTIFVGMMMTRILSLFQSVHSGTVEMGAIVIILIGAVCEKAWEYLNRRQEEKEMEQKRKDAVNRFKQGKKTADDEGEKKEHDDDPDSAANPDGKISK